MLKWLKNKRKVKNFMSDLEEQTNRAAKFVSNELEKNPESFYFNMIIGPLYKQTTKTRGKKYLSDIESFQYLRALVFCVDGVVQAMDELNNEQKADGQFYGDFISNFSYIVKHNDSIKVKELYLDGVAAILDTVPDYLRHMNDDGVWINCHEILNYFRNGCVKKASATLELIERENALQKAASDS